MKTKFIIKIEGEVDSDRVRNVIDALRESFGNEDFQLSGIGDRIAPDTHLIVINDETPYADSHDLQGVFGQIFTEREIDLIENCRIYAISENPAGLPGHNLMLIIEKLRDFARLLMLNLDGQVLGQVLQRIINDEREK